MKHLVLVPLLLVGCLEEPVLDEDDENNDEIQEIIGGVPDRIGNFPYLVSLQARGSDGAFHHVCGGSIVRADWIVTAAHCAVFPAASYRVVAGATYLDQISAAQKRGVVQVISHPSYNGDISHGYDIAVMKLSAPLTLGSVPRAIATASAAEVAEGVDAIGMQSLTAGWGRSGRELIVNPSFEQLQTGWALWLAGVKMPSTEDALFGPTSATMRLRSTASSYIQQRVTVAPGAMYVLRYWLDSSLVTAGSARAQIVWRVDATVLRTDNVPCDGVTWRSCSTTKVAPARANNALVRLVVTVGGGTAYFDNVSFLTPQVARPQLRSAAMRVRDGHEMFGLLPEHHILSENPIVEGVSTCFGDSGGPLVATLGPGRTYLIGVTSAGFAVEGRCDANLPSIFSRVARYEDFLDANLPPF